MLHVDGNIIRKAIVSLAIETVLLEKGKPILDEVTHKLYENYRCYVTDCYEHPEYLKKILLDLFGKSSIAIIRSIEKRLESCVMQEGIDIFVASIGHKNANHKTIQN